MRSSKSKTKSKTVQIKKPVIRHIVKTTKSVTAVFKKEIVQYLDSSGYLSWSSRERKYIILGTNSPKNGLMQCPECKLGELMVIRSRTTRKRFMGCSNFYGGCKASSPLLQKAKLRATKMPCDVCKWPMIIFRYSRNQKWTKQCGNFNCESRKIKPEN
jgi:putative DNA topoisomerase